MLVVNLTDGKNFSLTVASSNTTSLSFCAKDHLDSESCILDLVLRCLALNRELLILN